MFLRLGKIRLFYRDYLLANAKYLCAEPAQLKGRCFVYLPKRKQNQPLFLMYRTGFLAKAAFICNLFFLLCIILQRQQLAGKSETISLIAILGIILGMGIFNPISNILNGAVLLQRKPLFQWVPKWLALVNFCFLLFQITYILRIWT